MKNKIGIEIFDADVSYCLTCLQIEDYAGDKVECKISISIISSRPQNRFLRENEKRHFFEKNKSEQETTISMTRQGALLFSAGVRLDLQTTDELQGSEIGPADICRVAETSRGSW